MGNETDLAEHGGAMATRVQTVDADATVEGVFAEQATDKGGFAGAVGADQGDPFADPDVEADAIEYPGFAKGLGDIIELDHGARL
ncbi:hypothetical protein SDC9_172062 [bioreactor metagenome]|uniref:Uncharacterized protein n=1 Tax=bioreactor metagenome TaxID=1076179 RepID=A0A645GEY7_9ZZZZ